ncbi:MAG TPA: GH3 auxin-responsive promoter family protein, partial [Acetobacteraceae bacterium]|nr:GH3 auxin-responsive promoter family protein [Acetobacteraceae bacterium]
AGHMFLVELATAQAADPAAFAESLDLKLAALNEDYAAHRRGDVGMRPPEVRLVPTGRFAAWMQSRGKLGGQNKVPRVVTDPALLASLADFVSRR